MPMLMNELAPDKKTVMVVDDEAINRRIIKKCLEIDYEVIEAANGLEALSILDNDSSIAAILLDIIMPVMDGLEFLDKFKERSYSKIPVIVMTADHSNSAELEALHHGATDFVVKPFQPQILLSRINNAIARGQIALYQRMQYISEHDALTGLFRREKMFTEVQSILQDNPDTDFVFLRIDIDHFHLYNTSFGEREGDRLLQHLAGIIMTLAKTCQPSVTGRLTADVFCVCMAYKPDELESLVADANAQLCAYRDDYMLKLCVGAYIVEENTLSAEEMNVRAATGAKKIKGSYSGCLGIYDAQEAMKDTQELEITNEMRTALEQGQFVIYLQPKYELSTRTSTGAEALVRWKHPQKGLISPGVFIPLFEKNGFIAELDKYIWEQVCKLLRRWLDDGRKPYPVSTNISRVSLYNPQLVNVLVSLIEKYDLPPALLQLEITESAYMSDPDLMQKTIKALHSVGFTILMDDFGSGYSSLNTLKDIDIDVLKVDMKFLPTTKNVERGEIILASVVRMAHWLGLTVIMEGVETKAQCDFVNGIGCQYIQGYYFARPMPSEDYAAKYVYAVPDVDETAAAGHQSEPEPERGGAILVIDDDMITRTLLSSYFSEEYHVELCCTVAEGLDYLRGNAEKVRLVLIDNMLDGMNGMDFLEYCRTEGVLADIPKIMISSYSDAQTQAEAFRLGAYDFIPKPFAKDVVLARTAHVLELDTRMRSYAAAGRPIHSVMQRDADTGLLSRDAFRRIAAQTLLNYGVHPRGLLVVNIDNMTELHEKYGASGCIKLANCVANELRTAFRKSDLLARISDSCYAVMMTEITERGHAKLKAGLLRESLRRKVQEQLHIEIEVSIGVSVSMLADTIEDMTERGIEALHKAAETESRVYMYDDHAANPAERESGPIVMVCTGEEQLVSTLSLSYGESAAFAQAATAAQLADMLAKYGDRVRVICLDERCSGMDDAAEMCDIAQRHSKRLSLISICQEGQLQQLRHALTMNINDVIVLPPQMNVVRRQLANGIAGYTQTAKMMAVQKDKKES